MLGFWSSMSFKVSMSKSSSLSSCSRYTFYGRHFTAFIISLFNPKRVHITNTTFSHFLFVSAACIGTDGVRMINGVKWYDDGMGVNWGNGRTPRKIPNSVSQLKIPTSDRPASWVRGGAAIHSTIALEERETQMCMWLQWCDHFLINWHRKKRITDIFIRMVPQCIRLTIL